MSDLPGRPLLLTFRLDPDLRQRLKARLAADGKTMSAVVVHGLRQYVQHDQPDQPDEPDQPDQPEVAAAPPEAGRAALPEGGRAALPEHTAARLRELRASGRSGVLSATLAALHEAGWPLSALAVALGVSRQAIQVRVRQHVPAELRDRDTDCTPPPIPRRREPHQGKFRPHVTVKIDKALRAAAHRAAARDGRSLSLVVETILHRYLADDLPAPPSS